MHSATGRDFYCRDKQGADISIHDTEWLRSHNVQYALNIEAQLKSLKSVRILKPQWKYVTGCTSCMVAQNQGVLAQPT